jgi:hypothetical protein
VSLLPAFGGSLAGEAAVDTRNALALALLGCALANIGQLLALIAVRSLSSASFSR